MTDPRSLRDEWLIRSLVNNRALQRRSGLTPRLDARLAELVPALEREAKQRGLVIPQRRGRSRPLDPRIPRAPRDDELFRAARRVGEAGASRKVVQAGTVSFGHVTQRSYAS